MPSRALFSVDEDDEAGWCCSDRVERVLKIRQALFIFMSTAFFTLPSGLTFDFFHKAYYQFFHSVPSVVVLFFIQPSFRWRPSRKPASSLAVISPLVRDVPTFDPTAPLLASMRTSILASLLALSSSLALA
jgi:hypothetical protein